jgi:FtsH-binding integral membrane protein
MSILSSGVWERSGSNEMSRNVFYLVLGAILSWGFVLTMLVARSTAAWHPNIMMLLIVGLGLPVIGIFMSALSSNPLVSFAGFHLVVGGLSAILGPVLAMYDIKEPGLVERAAIMTGIVAAVMGASGFMFPNFYRSIGGALFGALIALVVVSFARIFIPAIQGVGIIDYISAGIFSLYIGYDMWRASDVPATLDNAVDVAVSLYLDILNLFLDLLRIMGSSDD